MAGWTDEQIKSHGPVTGTPHGPARRAAADNPTLRETFVNWRNFAQGIYPDDPWMAAAVIAYGMNRLGMFDDVLLDAGLDRPQMGLVLWKESGGPDQ